MTDFSYLFVQRHTLVGLPMRGCAVPAIAHTQQQIDHLWQCEAARGPLVQQLCLR